MSPYQACKCRFGIASKLWIANFFLLFIGLEKEINPLPRSRSRLVWGLSHPAGGDKSLELFRLPEIGWGAYNTVMRRRPWTLVILAFFHLVAPFGNVALNAYLTKKDIGDYFRMAMSPAYLEKNWIMFASLFVAGVSIYACKKWSFYVYLLSITVLFVFSYVGFLSKDGAIGFVPLFMVYLVNIAVVIYFLVPAVRNVYFDRRMRWWEIKPRYECNFQAQWNFEDNPVVHPGEVGNISENGMFLKSEIYPRDEDEVEISLDFDGGKHITFLGRVVFHSKAGKIGFGVEFNHTKDSKKQAQEIVSFLEEKGKRINTLDIRPEDSLTYWARTLVTTGKGLFPKSK